MKTNNLPMDASSIRARPVAANAKVPTGYKGPRGKADYEGRAR
jgi:hypothetical protein